MVVTVGAEEAGEPEGVVDPFVHDANTIANATNLTALGIEGPGGSVAPAGVLCEARGR